MKQLCSVWLRTGISQAPSETHAVLHDYIRDVALPSTRAVLLIVEIASAPVVPDNDPSNNPAPETKAGKQAAAAAAVAAAAAAANSVSVADDCSSFVHSLELKARYPVFSPLFSKPKNKSMMVAKVLWRGSWYVEALI